jgi:hypothetical protein
MGNNIRHSSSPVCVLASPASAKASARLADGARWPRADRPLVEAIQEFKIESNTPPAEFGRFNGGVVNLRTRTGSNALPARRRLERSRRRAILASCSWR